MIETFEGTTPQLHSTVYVHETAVVSGDVVMGAHSSVWPTTVVRGDINSIRIGSYTNLQDATVCHVTHDSRFHAGGYALTVGDHVTVGHRVTLHGCTIGDHCLIGMNAIILDGAELEPYVFLAAGSLVSPGKKLEGGYLWMGTPAKKIRPLTDQEREEIAYSAEHYAKLATRWVGSR